MLKEKRPEFWGTHGRKHINTLYMPEDDRPKSNGLLGFDGGFLCENNQEEGNQGAPAKGFILAGTGGAWQPGMEVLDIGAGAGIFTIPMAKQAARITALEPAPAMLAVLRNGSMRKGLLMWITSIRNGKFSMCRKSV